MPILLTTPWDPGNFDAGNTYPKAKIVSFQHQESFSGPMSDVARKTIKVVVDFGSVDGEGNWVSGGAPNKAKTYSIADHPSGNPHPYSDLVGDSPIGDETTYEAVKRALYNYLINSVPELAGTVE